MIQTVNISDITLGFAQMAQVSAQTKENNSFHTSTPTAGPDRIEIEEIEELEDSEEAFEDPFNQDLQPTHGLESEFEQWFGFFL